MDKRLLTNISLGIFVVIGFGLFVFLIFTMGGGTGILSAQYSLYGRFNDVKGLHAGSEVSLSGLRVGTVKNITVPGESQGLVVEFSIQKKVAEKIRKDSVAKVVTQGVLGDKYIELTIGSPDEPELKEGDFLQTSEVKDIFQKGGGLVDNLSQHFGRGSDFEALVRNLNVVAQNLVVFTNNLNKGNSGEKLAKAAGHLESIVKKADSGEGTLGGLINDPTVYEDLKAIMGGAKRSSILKSFMKSFLEDGKKEEKQK